MKRVIFLVCLLPVLAFSQQKLNLEEIWGKFAFSARSAQGFNVRNNGLTYVDVEEAAAGGMSLCEYELKSGKKIKELVNGKDIKFDNRVLDLGSYELSPNEDKLLLFEQQERVYRRSPRANYYVYDIAGKKTIQLSDKGKQMFPHFSPDGKKV